MINLRQSAIGVLEVSYFANTVVVVDQALKAAQVELVSCHKRLGGKMCHTVLAGSTSGVEAARPLPDPGAVEAAMEAARAAGRIVGEHNVKVAVTISNPHPQVLKLLNMIESHEAEKAAAGEKQTAADHKTGENPRDLKRERRTKNGRGN